MRSRLIYCPRFPVDKLKQWYMSPRVISAVSDNPTACEVFHIPFQSGNNEVLKRMRRGYTREKFLSIVKRIRDEFGEGPEVSITADLIVGFPGVHRTLFTNSMECAMLMGGPCLVCLRYFFSADMYLCSRDQAKRRRSLRTRFRSSKRWRAIVLG